MKNIKAARRYAVALLSVTDERRVVDAVAKDLELVGNTFRVSRDLRMLVASPVISRLKKEAVFRELFAGRIGTETQQFLILLIRKQREALLPAVAEEYLALRDERENIVNVDVTAAVDLTPAQETALSGAMARRTGKQVRLRLSRDPAITGGLVVKIGDTVLDDSVRHQLARIRRRFVEASAPSSMRKG